MTKKIRVYLDTNMVLDVFINRARALRKGENVLLPRKYEFMLANKEKIEFVTSFITKAEVARELSSGFGLNLEEIEDLWVDFAISLDCQFVDSFTFNADIAKFAASVQMKLRTLFNFMHLLIAADKNCCFVTGDKDLIEKAKVLLGNIIVIDYIKLRKLIEDAD